MRKVTVGLLGLSMASGFWIVLGPSAAASPPVGSPPVATPAKLKAAQGDELPNKLEEKRRELREQALDLVLTGKAKPEKRGASTVVKVGETADSTPSTRSIKPGADEAEQKDQYVELAREKTDKIFVILAEFGNERHPQYPDQDTDPETPGPTRFDGPLVNQIPGPDRTKDNSTVWRSDYNRPYYQNLYFGKGKNTESVKTYYETQSSGRYSVDGQVTDWVKVRYNEARYGRSGGFPCGGNVCSNTWQLIRDAVDTWVAEQKAAGRTDAQIKAGLASFDQWDRYDFDGDGNFNEPDGYLDHFQVVHAGGDEADGDPFQGEDAIWSHRWYAFQGDTGKTGPDNNKLGGTAVGATGLWVGDYTIQPENGGLSVFTHEYGHDLGLPDSYDTSGGGDNNNEHWTLMAQSRLSAKNDEGIGTRPGDIGQWEKLQLGWLDYEVVAAGQNRTLTLGPAEYNSAKPQGLVVVLPKKTVTTELAKPFAGTREWWSGSGDDLNNTLTRQVTLPAGSASLTFQANYDIEDCGPDPCDYAYVELDDGTGWKSIPGSITKTAEGNGIDGKSDAWVPATFDLSAYAGRTIGLRFRYATDGAAGGQGFFADEIAVKSGGSTIFTDGAESGDNGWTPAGFKATTGTETGQFDQYYIATNRTYVGYDRYLKTGPYNFGFLNTKPDWVEHYAYQQGLLVSYWDTSQANNNTNEHPGEGLSMIIDSRPRPVYNLNGVPWRARIQVYDAPFGLSKADSMTLHLNGKASYFRGQDAAPVFDDTKQYFFPELPNHGVKLPKVGVRIQVLEQSGTSVKIKVSKK